MNPYSALHSTPRRRSVCISGCVRQSRGALSRTRALSRSVFRPTQHQEAQAQHDQPGARWFGHHENQAPIHQGRLGPSPVHVGQEQRPASAGVQAQERVQ